MRIDYLQARCRAALAACRQASPSQRRTYLKEAWLAERKLEVEGTPWAAAVASVLQASIAAAEGRTDLRPRLSQAADKLRAVDGLLLAAAAEVRLAQIGGGCPESAGARMLRLGVANVQRMTTALLPGFED